MNEIATKTLEELIKKYESSKSSYNENQVNQTFSLVLYSRTKRKDKVGERLFKRYIDGDDYDYYLECNETFKELEKIGYCTFKYQNERCEEIILNTDKIQEIYAELGKTPKIVVDNQAIAHIEQLLSSGDDAPQTKAFLQMLLERLQAHQSCKSFFNDLDDLNRTITAAKALETNASETYIRNFSKHVLGDSKALENMGAKILKVFPAYDSFDVLLVEHLIYKVKTPTLVKGPLAIDVAGQRFDLGLLEGEFAFSSSVLDATSFLSCQANKVITIENQTTFYDYQDEDAVIVYLGGYASGNRIRLLKLLHDRFPHLAFYHFGDIDWGGFQIFDHLCNVTGIAFELLHMDIETLKKYQGESIHLNDDDRRRLSKYLEKDDNRFKDVISYMLEHNVKLEQESLSEEIRTN